MKLYLIEAERDRAQSPTSDWFDASSHKFLCPSLGISTIASLTPRNIGIKVIDEKIDDLDFDDLPDAVAISFKTMSSKRAYELSRIFRDKKIKVILGGVHASLLPEEARQHCDSVVVGEAEEIWPYVMKDLQAGELQPFYRMSGLTNLSKLPLLRPELLKTERYLCHSIQTSRGCSLNCEFCPTKEMFGGVFRTKPISKVVEEIQTVFSAERKYIFFTDDIFGAGDEEFTLELLKQIKKLKIEFFIISDFLVLNKKIIVELARSGCRYISLNLPGTCSLEEVKAIKMIQALGIDVWGYFMFGFRFHEKDVFRKAYDFVYRTGMRHVSFTVMTPYPNTLAGKKLESEGRILSRDWAFYDQTHVVFKPEKMVPEELEEGFRWIKEKLGYLSRFSSAEKVSFLRKLKGNLLCSAARLLPKEKTKDRKVKIINARDR